MKDYAVTTHVTIPDEEESFLSQDIPKKLTPSQKYQIVNGNNGKLIRKVLEETWSELWYETPSAVEAGT